MMRRRRFIQALPLWLQSFVCTLLINHVYEIDPTTDDCLRLRCQVCPHKSAGVDVRTPAYRQTQPGDARRRRGRVARPQPEPLPVDWFAEQHFQGDHARAL